MMYGKPLKKVDNEVLPNEIRNYGIDRSEHKQFSSYLDTGIAHT